MPGEPGAADRGAPHLLHSALGRRRLRAGVTREMRRGQSYIARRVDEMTPGAIEDIYQLTSEGAALTEIVRRGAVPPVAALWYATECLDRYERSHRDQALQLGVSVRTIERYRARRRATGHAA